MIWLRLLVWWMNCATRLGSWMLQFHDRASLGVSQAGTVRVVTKQGSIVRTSPAEPPSQWPPLVFPLTSTEKPSITWFLLTNTRGMLERTGARGGENWAVPTTWVTVSVQAPARGPKQREQPNSDTPSAPHSLVG